MRFAILLGLLAAHTACAGLPPTTIRGQSDATPKTKFAFQVPHKQATDLGGIKTLVETGSQNILANPGMEASAQAWTVSAGTLTLESGAGNFATGVQSIKWIPNAASDTAASPSATIPTGFYNSNGEAACYVKTSGVLHKLQVYDGANVIAQTEVITGASSFAKVSLNFVFPGSGSVSIRVLAGDTATIYVDECYLGPARNIGTLELVKTAVVAEGAACAGSPCTITRQSPSGWLSSVTRSAAGTYTANIAAGIFSVAPTCNITVNQNSAKIGTVTTTAVPFTTTDSADAATDSQNIHISCSPTNQDIARLELQGLSWAGYHGTDCNWTYVGAVVDSPDDGSCTFTERLNNNFGTVTSYGSSKAGIVFTPKKTGTYYVCAIANGSNTGTTVPIELSDTAGPTIVAEGNSSASMLGRGSTTICGAYQVAALTSKTLRLRSSTGFVLNGVNTVTVDWSIFDVSQAVPMPILVNSVFSGYAGQSRLEHAQLQNSNGATCPVTTGSSSWISGARNAAGDCTWTFTGFSAAPTCTCSVVRPTGGQSFCTYNAQPTSTTLRILTLDGGTLTDRDIDLICIGPR